MKKNAQVKKRKKMLYEIMCCKEYTPMRAKDLAVLLQIPAGKRDELHKILDMLLAVKPCNMLVLMTAFLQSYGTISHGAFTEQSSYMEIWPHIVNELESTGGVMIAGPLEYSTVLEIHPAE